MASKIPVCARVGLVAGFFTGFMIQNFVKQNPSPPVAELLLNGVVVALIFGLLAGWMHVLMFRYSRGPMFLVAFITSIVVGLIVPLAVQAIANIGVAGLLGSIAGFILGWIVCALLCRRKATLGGAGVTHG